LANITLLHWNIQHFSNDKADDMVNGNALINYIAWVVAKSKANIVSILEIANSAVDNVTDRLMRAIDVANGDDPDNTQWRSIPIDSGKNHEAYVVLYRLGKNFKALTAVGATDVIRGLTNSARVDKPGALRFNSGKTTSGGRKPFYVAFETTDTKKKFTVVALHVMFSSVLSQIGVRNVALIAQNQAILYAGKKLDLDASLTAADFNVDFDFFFPGPYEGLIKLPSQYTTVEKTTLVKRTPPTPPPFSHQYRANAYDNIFLYKVKDPPLVPDGKVIDLLSESTTKPKGTGELTKQIEAFKADGITNGKAIQKIPPEDFEDAWHIVSEAISDHLPVFINIAI
jgi:hypothetical protein